MQVKGKPKAYSDRVNWLIDNYHLWHDRSVYFVINLMVQNKLYSEKSGRRDLSYTIDTMMMIARKYIDQTKNTPQLSQTGNTKP